MRKTALTSMTGSALLLSIGYVLPFLTGQIPEIGNLLLPMHLPVMICGIIFGGAFGAAVGFVLPITRSLIFSRPVMFPSAIAMSFELCTYGLVIGALCSLIKPKRFLSVYPPLIASMLIGRAVWGVVMYLLLGLFGDGFSPTLFISGAFLDAIPGIILQLMLIPSLTVLLVKANVIEYDGISVKRNGKGRK